MLENSGAGQDLSIEAEVLLGLERVPDLATVRKALTQFDAISQAVAAGRVSTLFVRAGEALYGSCDEESRQTSVHNHPEPFDEELIGKLATRVATASGIVRWIERPDLPGGGPLAAMYHD